MTTMTQDQVWQQFDRMQRSIMAEGSLTKKKDFFSETLEEQKRFYNWMCCNCGKILASRPWY